VTLAEVASTTRVFLAKGAKLAKEEFDAIRAGRSILPFLGALGVLGERK
jgi:hypothetical protein